MIQIKKLSVFYKLKKESINVLNQINFNAKNDDICAVIGCSGCGKTTLLNVLSGIIKNYEGEVFLNDEILNPHIHNIGIIPQNFGLLPWKTVEQNCLLPFKIKKKKITDDILKKMNFIMCSLNIQGLNKRYISELSGGQKQRVAIARAFLMQNDLLLMDEPFSALDEIIREEAQELFLDFWNKNKISTFFVTHSIDEALYMGKKIIIMSEKKGNILEVIDNKLFNNKNYKDDKDYASVFSHIKGLIRKEDFL